MERKYKIIIKLVLLMITIIINRDIEPIPYHMSRTIGTCTILDINHHFDVQQIIITFKSDIEHVHFNKINLHLFHINKYEINDSLACYSRNMDDKDYPVYIWVPNTPEPIIIYERKMTSYEIFRILFSTFSIVLWGYEVYNSFLILYNSYKTKC